MRKISAKGLFTITAILAIITVLFCYNHPTFAFHTALLMLACGLRVGKRWDELYEN